MWASSICAWGSKKSMRAKGKEVSTDSLVLSVSMSLSELLYLFLFLSVSLSLSLLQWFYSVWVLGGLDTNSWEFHISWWGSHRSRMFKTVCHTAGDVIRRKIMNANTLANLLLCINIISKPQTSVNYL